MKIDIHCHVVGSDSDMNQVDQDVYFNPRDNPHWFTRILYNLLEEDLLRLEADVNQDEKISTGEYFNLFYKLVSSPAERLIRGTDIPIPVDS